jgi:hypothetical protein
MAMSGLDHDEKLGHLTSRGVINRLGNDALMPDNYFHLGTPEQTLYEYYLQGPAQWVVEWVRPGVENHVRIDKRSLPDRSQLVATSPRCHHSKENARQNLIAIVEFCWDTAINLSK